MDLSIQAVIFDKDGVLFPTEELSQACWMSATLELVGGSPRAEDFHCLLGVTKVQGDSLLKRKFGSDFPSDRVRVRSKELFSQRLRDEGLEPKEGVREYLELLKSAGIPAAIATSASREFTVAQLKLTGLTDYFQNITCGTSEPDLRSKPAPDIFLRAAEQLKVDPQACIAYEDSQAGVISAFLANMQVYHVRDILPPTSLIKNLSKKCLMSFKDLLT